MTDTQWLTWEVFHQTQRGAPHIHVGSVHAPDAEMALLMAKEQFARRQACVNLWLVPTHAIYASPYEDADIFEHGTDKSYREAFGYKVRDRVRAANLNDEDKQEDIPEEA
ncbi:MAG: 1,2-phenylacetyl-CoA epoxidase subunit B [Anaerolineales bacterium]|nr:1,2-phenylacetyl-CoA epoxidase subunit B [Anaerolineales bacterium]